MPAPKVTALITVFNEETWIHASVNSLLKQNFSDIEILVIDDGSDDATPDILADYNDPRLRVIRKERIGRAAALAFGMNEAKGEYVAVQDADDESYPERIGKQVSFLAEHKDVAWLGCGEERRDTQRGENAMRLYPQTDLALRRMSTRCIPYSHSGVMIRRSILQDGLNYDPAIPYLIDFDLFLRVAELHRVANLPEVLVLRRVRNESFFQSQFKRRAQNRRLIQMSFGAVRRFGLPAWYYFYPISRFAYDYFPNWAKFVIRRSAGLEEHREALTK